MGSFGGYYSGEKRKKKKDDLLKKANQFSTNYQVPNVEILGKKKKKF